MTVETKNKIGLIGFAVLILGIGAYTAWANWPVTWTKDGRLLNADITSMPADDLRTQLAAIDPDKLTDAQKRALAEKLRLRWENTPEDLRRAAFFRGMGGPRGETPDPTEEAYRRNMREIMQLAREQDIENYVKASAEDRKAILDQMIDTEEARRREWQQRATTRAATRPAGEVRTSTNGQPRGPGSGFGPGSGDRRNWAGRAASRLADALTDRDAQQRAAARQLREDLQKRREERGLPTQGGRGGWR